MQILLSIPFFYLLTFAGHDEESEIEIGVMCASLGLGLGILTYEYVQVRSLAFVVPLVVYFGYTMKVLPGLRVLKHAFRGLSYARVGRHRRALQAFRRALQLDPNNRLARDGFWDVHRSLDLEQLAGDPQTLALVDLDLCLQRAGSLLLQPGPSAAQLDEAHRLLDLVLLYSRRCVLRSITGGPSLTPTPAATTNPPQSWNTSSIPRTMAPAIRSDTTSCCPPGSSFCCCTTSCAAASDNRNWRCPAAAWKPSPPSSAISPTTPTIRPPGD